jgi:hypothetical protein
MEAQRPASAAAILSVGAAELLRSMLRCLAWSTAAVALATSLVLLARRFAGALERPLEGATLVALGAGASALAFVLHAAWRSGESRPARRNEPARYELRFTLVVTAALTALGAAVSLPGSSRGALWFLWVLLIGQESAWWIAALRRSHLGPAIARLTRRRRTAAGSSARRAAIERRSRRASGRTPAETLAAAQAAPSVSTASIDGGRTTIAVPSSEPIAATTLSPGATQQLSRIAEEGGEALYGLLRADFAPRQRTQSLHVAFCPPLEAAPIIECSQIDGPEASIKVAQLQPFGVRFDLRLASIPREATSVVVRFEAHCESHTANATQIPNQKPQITNNL